MHDENQMEPDLRLIEDDEWLDEALRETFPASDPIPLFHGVPEIARQSKRVALEPTDSIRFIEE